MGNTERPRKEESRRSGKRGRGRKAGRLKGF
jgi:hypothetical protein